MLPRGEITTVGFLRVNFGTVAEQSQAHTYSSRLCRVMKNG